MRLEEKMKLRLEQILMQFETLSVEFLEENKNSIFEIIPELKCEEGFDQKSSWHIYDVWKHTEVALSKSNPDLEERIALLLHDIGKPHSYQEENSIRHFKGHAYKSAEMSKLILRRLKYDEGQIDLICWLIANHSTKIDPNKISKDNLKKMKKLLDIQYCDTKAYNPEKIESAIHTLDLIKVEMLKKENFFYEDEIR